MSARRDRDEALRKKVEKANRDLEILRDEIERVSAGLPWRSRSAQRRLDWAVRRLDLVMAGLTQELMAGPDPSSLEHLLALAKRAVAVTAATVAVAGGSGIAEGAGTEMYNELRGRAAACEIAIDEAVGEAAETPDSPGGEAPEDGDDVVNDDQNDELATGFSGKAASEIVGITYRQLDYWARTDLVRPELATAQGSGSRRRYSHRNLLELKLVKTMLDAGIRLEAVREVFAYVRTEIPGLASARLVVAGREALLARDPAELVEIIGGYESQGILNLNVISLEEMRRDLDEDIRNLTG